ncbi:MAG: hypothetical protein JRG96_19995 [Deltaproteobacteria bacterium]|nr:hypothetical protein [Deltaproteobacteria bacterium]MBW2416945.1 hypothetical protein [Deltaproteobacteria bacterium]
MLRVIWAVALAALPVWVADAAANDDEVRAAEAMVRARYYEGLPVERARACSVQCAARLIEMLADPDETPYHANILYVLGHSDHPGAHEALAGYAGREPEGRVSGAVYNARVQLLLSLGERARRDPRALSLLVARLERAEAGSETPGWWVGPLRGEGLREVMYQGVMRGLALSGSSEAGARLRAREAAARARSGDDASLSGLRDSLELHERMARENAQQGFDTGDARR